jgi:hypothetical protein
MNSFFEGRKRQQSSLNANPVNTALPGSLCWTFEKGVYVDGAPRFFKLNAFIA